MSKRGPGLVGREVPLAPVDDPVLPYKAGRIGCLLLAFLVFTAATLLLSGNAQPATVWLFLLGAACLWIAWILRRPPAL